MTPQEKARALRPIIEKAAESLSDNDALDAIELFEHWETDKDYTRGKRLQHNGDLWAVLQDHTSHGQYPPSIHTASLYAMVERPGEGDDQSNPIPYNNNMELIEGKYYSQGGVTYRCIRGTGIPVYNDLADLVGNYVEVVA